MTIDMRKEIAPFIILGFGIISCACGLEKIGDYFKEYQACLKDPVCYTERMERQDKENRKDLEVFSKWKYFIR